MPCFYLIILQSICGLMSLLFIQFVSNFYFITKDAGISIFGLLIYTLPCFPEDLTPQECSFSHIYDFLRKFPKIGRKEPWDMPIFWLLLCVIIAALQRVVPFLLLSPALYETLMNTFKLRQCSFKESELRLTVTLLFIQLLVKLNEGIYFLTLRRFADK